MDSGYACCTGQAAGCPQHRQQWLEDRRSRWQVFEDRREAGNTQFSRQTFGRLT